METDGLGFLGLFGFFVARDEAVGIVAHDAVYACGH
jgi:hypothetical protein